MQTLKGCWEKMRGARIKYKIKELYWQLHYAWQRAWRGYDETDIFNYDMSFFSHCATCVDKLNKTRNTLINDLTDEETSAIMNRIAELAAHLADDSYYYKEEFVKGVEAMKRAREKREEEKHEFFILFEKYIDSLWD